MTKIVYFTICYFFAFAINLIVAVSNVKAETESAEDSKPMLHTISKGETLHMLAGYYLNNPRMWKKIFDANRKVIKKPSSLVVGSQLAISVPDSWHPILPFEEFKKLATGKRNDLKR